MPKPLFSRQTSAFQIAVALIGGMLMGLTPAPTEAWFLGWFALVPLWVLVRQKEAGARLLIPIALAWGLGYYGLTLFWITGVHPMTWMDVPWLASIAIALFCWIFITLWGTALAVVWSLAIAFLSRRARSFSPLLFVLIGVALWCGLEALWSAGPLWWSSLAYTQSPHNLAILQLSQLSGPSTVTATIVAVNGFIAEAWLSYSKQGSRGAGETRRQFRIQNSEFRIRNHSSLITPSSNYLKPATLISIALGLLVSLHLIGLGMYSRPVSQSEDQAIKIGIIQGNIPNKIKLYPEGKRRAIEGYTNGYKTLADQGLDAVLTPEGALPFYQSKLMRSSFVSAVEEKGVIAWVGAFGDRETGYSNSLFTITSTGEQRRQRAEGRGQRNSLSAESTSRRRADREQASGFLTELCLVAPSQEESGSPSELLLLPPASCFLPSERSEVEIFSRYDKVKLVPLGEYIPFEQYLGGIVGRLSPLEARLRAGNPTQTFETPFGKAIVGICYETAFAKHFQRQAARGGEFILGPSNDDHYSETMPAQHHALDVMHAIENDRWAARATNTGYSAIVNPRGRTLWISSMNTYELHADTIYRRQTQTLYVRWGDWLTLVLLGLGAIGWFVGSPR